MSIERVEPEIGPEVKKSGLASTAKMFRIESEENKMMKRGDTWMCCPRGTVSWSSINQGWFKSRAVSSREQEQEVGPPGKAFTFGFICRQRRMRVVLRLTSPLFLLFFPLVLRAEPEQQPAPRDPRVMEAAKMYEIYFLNQMMRAMRSTVAHSDLSKPSMGESIYREQLDDQYVQSWADQGGVGLAEMIHDELQGKVVARREVAARRGQKRESMALTDRDTLGVRRLPQTRPGEERVLVSLRRGTAPRGEKESVRAPWSGTVTGVRVQDEKTVLSFSSRSASGREREIQMAWDGVPNRVRIGDSLRADDVIGFLSPAAQGVIVSTRPKVQEQ